MTTILKMFFGITIILCCGYGVKIFGFSFWPILFLCLAAVVILSIFLPSLAGLSKTIASFIAWLSLSALILLMIASTIGGSAHMSESNEVIAIFLFFMSLFGASSYFWKIGDSNTEEEKQLS